MPVNIPNNGTTTDLTPDIRVAVCGPVPIGTIIRIKRNGTTVGNATEISPGQYSFIDTAPLGAASYVAELVSGATVIPSVARNITFNSTGPTTLFLDTFTSSTFTPVSARAPETGTWSTSAIFYVDNGSMFATVMNANVPAVSSNFMSTSGEYTLTFDFVANFTPGPSDDFTITLTDGLGLGVLTTAVRYFYQDDAIETYVYNNATVNPINLYGYYPAGSSGFPGVTAGQAHTITIQIAPNLYNFKFDGVNLGSGPYVLRSETFIQPRIQVETFDAGGLTTNKRFLFTNVSVVDGIV